MAYMLENPYWLVILGVLIVITIFVCIKAGKASSKRYKANEEIMKKLKEENILRNEFSVLTPSLAESADPIRLFKGVALNLQKKISDSADMIYAFDNLTKEQQEIYALSFVVEDGGEKLSSFFKSNGQPLTGAAFRGFTRLFDGRADELFAKEYNAYDPENETDSLIPAEIEKYDAEFSQLVTADFICEAAGRFIKENYEKFI
ncbi:MAG: hypothetical protein E7516_06515 [Ruminococcaceae bacterium]|nr:hypothetical protein [Oscillospiraceae bacterium]